MTISSDVEEARDVLLSITDEFVYENQLVCPEDMYFLSLLVSEYYESQSKQGSGSLGACEVAWTFAKEIASRVENTEDFDWLNAHFVLDGVFSSVQSDHIDYPSRNKTDDWKNPTHFTNFYVSFDELTSGKDALPETTTALNEMQEVLKLYVDLDTEDEDSIEGMDKSRSIGMVIHHLGKRYAHEFPDDILESSVSFELVELLVEFKESERFSARDLYMGLRMATNWTELRAKREHEMLCVGMK